MKNFQIPEVLAAPPGRVTLQEDKFENLEVYLQPALEFRNRSQYDRGLAQESVVARVVSALRKEFGGHEEKKAE